MKKIFCTLALSLVLLGYQNCSFDPSHKGGRSVSLASFKICDQPEAKMFLDSYYPRFLDTCSSCHVENGSGFGKFASSNPNLAFSEFQSLGRARVERNFVNAGHRFPADQVQQNQAIITAASQGWQSAEASAAACRGTPSYLTSSKQAPANTYTQNPGNTAAWPRIEWDLETTLPSGLTPVKAVFSLEIRRMRLNNQNVGYELKNPRIRVKDGTITYRFQGLSIVMNGVLLSDVTTYSLLDFVVNSTTDVIMYPSSAFSSIVVNPVNSDQFAVRFAQILDGTGLPVSDPTNPAPPPPQGPTIPARVTYTQLMSNDALLGVFQRSCVSCHSNAVAAGGLNLQNYANASVQASNILSRMNNGNNPMPPSGLLGTTDRSVVQAWVASGAPQN